MYIDKLFDTVNKYNNAYHSTIKMKPADKESSSFINFDVGNNNKDPKFEIFEHVRISKYNNFFFQTFTLQICPKKLL